MMDIHALWVTAPEQAFTAFMTSPDYAKTAFKHRAKDHLSKESLSVYKAMFDHFIVFIKERNQTILSVAPMDIYAFLTQTKQSDNGHELILQSAIQHRYLRLLERIFTFLNRSPRPTDDLLFGPMREHYKLRGKNRNTVFLNDEQIQAFLLHLPEPTAKERLYRPSANWKIRRNRALQCLLLGAGLKVAEVIALTLDEINPTVEFDGSLKIELQELASEVDATKHPTFYAHTTFLQSQFVPIVIEWLNERKAMDLVGNLVFPNTDGKVLNKASIYRQIKQTFERANLDMPRIGGRTLRNTFAVTEINRGTDLDVVSKKLGLFEDRSIDVYVSANKITHHEL